MSTENALKPNVDDEETPLLPKPKVTPLPWFQFSIVLFLQLAEPLTSNVIYPFVPQLVRDIGITNGDESKVGYYVRLMASLFFLTQTFTVLHYSRISDRIGRKPVILFGLFGLSLSMYSFGLSKTFWGLVFSRSLNGALNGNIGVMKSMVVEITDPTNISKAYAYMPISWSTGSTLGPVIGGSLSHPAERFPKIFGNSEFHKEYPYFLPCAVPATFSLVCWLVVYFFLEETVPSKTPLSQLIKFRRKSNTNTADPKGSDSATNPDVPAVPEAEKPLPLRSLLTYKVIVSAGNYATLSLIDIAYRGVLPLFFATPIELGGLGLTPPVIGNILSLFGILNGIAQVFFFAKIHDTLGTKNTFTYGIVGCLPMIASFPVMNYIAKQSGDMDGLSWGIWALIGIQIIFSIGMNCSYGAIFIYIAGAPPNRASVGAVNGLAQTTVSFMRAVGPAATNSLFSLSIQYNYLGGSLVYVALAGMVAIATWCALLLPRQVWRD